MRSYLARAAFAVARAFGAGNVFERAPRLPSSHSGKVMTDLSMWQQFQRIGGSITPQQVSSIIREADTGDMRRLQDLANDARQKDCHLQAVLSQSEEAIAELDWQMTLPKDAKARDKRNAAFVEEALRGCKGTAEESKDGFADLIPHLAGAVYHAYAVSEVAYTKKNGKIVPKSFSNRAPRRFGFRQSDGAFIWRDEDMPADGVEIRKVFPGKFVVAMPRVTGDVPSREGLARVLMWAALFRNWTLTDWLRTGEISWKPWRVASYDKAAMNDEDVDDLVTVLQELTNNGAAALPNAVDLKIHWPSGIGSQQGTHSLLFDVMGREMSKAVLGQTDTVDSSKARGHAQASVMSAAEKRRIRSRARYIATVITRDVVRPLIEMNFGRNATVPDFEFILKEPVDLKAFGEGVAKLVDAGAQVTQGYVRDQTGMPEPKAGDTVLVPPKAPAATPIDAGDTEDDKPDSDPPTEEPPSAPDESDDDGEDERQAA